MIISPKFLFPLLATAWVGYIMVRYDSGIDRAYLLFITTLPFSLIASLVAEIANSVAGGYAWGNAVATVLMLFFLLAEAYYLGKFFSWVLLKLSSKKGSP